MGKAPFLSHIFSPRVRWIIMRSRLGDIGHMGALLDTGARGAYREVPAQGHRAYGGAA